MQNVTDDRTEPGPTPDAEVPAEVAVALAPTVMADGETEIDVDSYDTPEVPARKPKMFNKLSVCLAFLLAIAGGFYGGVYMQKRHTPATTAASARGGFGGGRNAAAAAAAAGGTSTAGATTGAGAAAAGAGGGTRGTVVLVDAPNHAIYIQDAQGNAIKVAVSSDTIMKFSKSTTDPNDYAIGATVTVIGTTDATTGNITATAITEGAARGGGGGGGGGGTGAGAAAGAGTGTATGGATTASTTAKSG